MYTHEPENYQCPFCRISKRVEDKFVITKQSDIVFQNEMVTAFIASHWWPNNPGHIIIIPNKHFENLYNLPDNISAEIHRIEKKVALGFKKVYRCDGVSSRQHNEPAGDQDVWHYHLHVFPRYIDDNLYQLDRKQTAEAERAPYVKKLKSYFEEI
jgi:histidine triad (HIT) family protein